MLSLFLKIIGVCLGLLAIGKTLIDFRKKEDSLTMASFWILLWTIIIIVAINPALIARTVEAMSGRGGTIGQIVGVGFVFIIFVLYRLYLKAQRNEQKIVRLVRRMALHEALSPKRKK